MYDPDHPQHLQYLEQHRQRWTPAKEAQFQAQLAQSRAIAAGSSSWRETLSRAAPLAGAPDMPWQRKEMARG